MARNAISQDELLQLINGEMAKHDDCRNLQITGVSRADADDGSANWGEPFRWRRSGPDNDSVSCTDCLRRFVQQLWKTYDVDW